PITASWNSGEPALTTFACHPLPTRSDCAKPFKKAWLPRRVLWWRHRRKQRILSPSAPPGSSSCFGLVYCGILRIERQCVLLDSRATKKGPLEAGRWKEKSTKKD